MVQLVFVTMLVITDEFHIFVFNHFKKMSAYSGIGGRTSTDFA